ncbi:type IV pilin protein [Craterilacuibacter sp. RT1T]|nr:type IV pilin protein [Craterilacuibacter sp. RT1T]
MHAQALERLHSVGGSYQNAAGDACGINDPDNNQYVIETECGDANSFTITATPNDGGMQAADGTQTLDQSGARGGSVQNGQWTN